MAGSEEQAQAKRLLEIHRRNLRRAEEKKANFGPFAAPTQLENEIDDLKSSIAELEQHQPVSPTLQRARDAVRGQYDNDIDFIIADSAGRNRRQTRLEERQDAQGTDIHEMRKLVLNLLEDWRQDKTTADRGRKRNFILQSANLVLLCGVILALFALAVRVFGWYG